VVLDAFAQRLGHHVQCLLPLHRLPAIGAAQHGLVEALGTVDALVAEAVAVGQPDFVNRLVLARRHAHQSAAADVQLQGGTDAVVRGNRGRLGHFPGTRLEAERPRSERTDRAHIDNVTGQFGFDVVLDIGADLDVFAATHAAHLLVTGHVLQEAYAAGAVYAARHVRGDQRAEVLVLHHAFLFGETRHAAAVLQRQVLQLALAALVADRAIQRVVDEQKLHHRALRRLGVVGTGVDLHAVHDRGGAGRQRLGCLLDFHHAHAAVGGDRQFLVVAEARNRDAVGVGDLDDHGALACLEGFAVDLDVEHVPGHAVRLGAHAAAPLLPAAR